MSGREGAIGERRSPSNMFKVNGCPESRVLPNCLCDPAFPPTSVNNLNEFNFSSSNNDLLLGWDMRKTCIGKRDEKTSALFPIQRVNCCHGLDMDLHLLVESRHPHHFWNHLRCKKHSKATVTIVQIRLPNRARPACFPRQISEGNGSQRPCCTQHMEPCDLHCIDFHFDLASCTANLSAGLDSRILGISLVVAAVGLDKHLFIVEASRFSSVFHFESLGPFSLSSQAMLG